MQFIANLKTMPKLLGVVALSGAIMLAVGVLGIVKMDQINTMLNTLYERDMVGLSELKDANLAMTRIGREMRTAILNTEVAEMQKNAEHIATFKKQFTEHFGKYEKLILKPETKAMAAEVEKLFETYMERIDQIMALTLKAQNDEAMKVMKANAATGNELEQKMTALAESKEQLGKQAYDESDVVFAENRRIIIGAIVVGLFLGVLVSWLIARQLVNNLQDVVGAAQKLAAGDLAARSRVTTKEETGQLATAFNQMGEKIQSDVTKALESKGKMEAVSKAQAIVEFNPDGTVIAANDNFLKCMGYSLDELTGRHHRMFCEPAYTNSADYANFWSKLNRGEFDAGVYRRLAKGNKEVWLQASYNPILDASGKPMKVVKLATDITEQKNKAAEFEGKMKAVGKAQAVAEFNLDGTVITANQNFLSALGYSLDEITGHHHRMFCEATYTGSPEYQAFWAKLNRGEFDAGTYRRVGKGGKEVWLQASYNPILDANGKPMKVVKYAMDITGQKQAQNEVEKLIQLAAAGQLAERIQTERFEGTAKMLTQSFNQLLDAVTTPLKEAQTVLTALAGNDLTKTMTGSYQGEFEQMKASLNGALTNLSTTMMTVREAVEAVSNGAEEITRGNEDLSQRTSQQASALEETSASMEEMTSTVKQNADNAKQANQLASAARETADKGGEVTAKPAARRSPTSSR